MSLSLARDIVNVLNDHVSDSSKEVHKVISFLSFQVLETLMAMDAHLPPSMKEVLMSCISSKIALGRYLPPYLYLAS